MRRDSMLHSMRAGSVMRSFSKKEGQPRWRRWGTRAVVWGGITGCTYVGVEMATDHSPTRCLRALSAFIRICVDYKFTSHGTADEYVAIHQRTANLILDTCRKNEGLYIKLGQGLNTMSHVLPREYTETLKVLLDAAPPVPLNDIRRTIKEETGRELDDLFDRFDAEPVATASVAQVHRAWLRSSEDFPSRQVAVKVQKPSIAKQAKWDISVLNMMCWALRKSFDLPIEWMRETIVDALNREIDFTVEAQNAETIRQNFADDSRYYVPHVYHEYTTPKLLVMEWLEATKLLDTQAIREQYDDVAVLKTVFDGFGDMLFKHGFVHCDPHGANVLILPAPRATASVSQAHNSSASPCWWRKLLCGGKRKNDFQVAFIDFGMCVPLTERFRLQYALLFKSLFTRDMDSLNRVVTGWGIGDTETFATMQAQKPLSALRGGKYGEITREEVFSMRRSGREGVKSFLRDEAMIPRELSLVGRGMDILRGINRLYGSPVSRVNMFVNRAVQSLGPLHDYDGIKRYLERVGTLVPDASDQVCTRLYDANAEVMREAQAAALREHERSHSAVRRVVNRLTYMYHMSIFQLILLQITALYNVVWWYNYVIGLILSADTAATYRLGTIEERMEQM